MANISVWTSVAPITLLPGCHQTILSVGYRLFLDFFTTISNLVLLTKSGWIPSNFDFSDFRYELHRTFPAVYLFFTVHSSLQVAILSRRISKSFEQIPASLNTVAVKVEYPVFSQTDLILFWCEHLQNWVFHPSSWRTENSPILIQFEVSRRKFIDSIYFCCTVSMYQ